MAHNVCENAVGTPKSLSSVPKKRRLTETSLSSDEIKTRKVESSTEKCDINMTVNKLEEMCTKDNELALKYAQLKISVKEKEEKRRILKLVQTYRARDNIENLDELTEKWLKICQSAIMDLYAKLPATDPKPTLTQLIDHLKVDHKLIDYNAEEEDFSQ